MIEVKKLNYDFSALKPVVSPETLFFHHEKHYAGYVTKANELLPTKWKKKTLAELISLSREQKNIVLFNQIAQVWNHEFFFNGLSVLPSDKEISGPLLGLIQTDFQSIDNVKAELVKAATSCFGSGWVWLVFDKGHLKVQITHNAETPFGLEGVKPLWTLDVWEHAYYLDYQNRRADYALEVVENAMNWRFISNQLGV